jgi:CHASE3 domain sensor protein
LFSFLPYWLVWVAHLTSRQTRTAEQHGTREKRPTGLKAHCDPAHAAPQRKASSANRSPQVDIELEIGLAFGAAILAWPVVGAISYRTMVVSRDSERWVRHTHEVLENLQNLLIASGSTESSYRGFVLTGQQRHSASYRANILGWKRHETAVRNLTVDDPAQQRRISDTERLTAQDIQFVERVVALRRAESFAAAADAIRTGQDERVKGQFLEKIRELQQEELRC